MRGWPTALSSRGIRVDHLNQTAAENTNDNSGFSGDVDVMYHVDISSPAEDSPSDGIRGGVLEITIDTDEVVPAREEMMIVVDTEIRAEEGERRNFCVILECSREDSTSVNSFITESTNALKERDSSESGGADGGVTARKVVLFVFQRRKKCTAAEISSEDTRTVRFFWAHQLHVEEEGSRKLLETDQPVLVIKKKGGDGNEDGEGEKLGYAELIFLGKPGIERLKYSDIAVMERNTKE